MDYKQRHSVSATPIGRAEAPTQKDLGEPKTQFKRANRDFLNDVYVQAAGSMTSERMP
jgi:hypothetical protein